MNAKNICFVVIISLIVSIVVSLVVVRVTKANQSKELTAKNRPQGKAGFGQTEPELIA